MWLPVRDYPGYSVSDTGQVRNDVTRVVLTHCVTGRGYHKVTLCGRQVQVSRLVLTAFKCDPLPGEVARHKDHDKDNNTLANLTWGTQQDNMDDSVRDQRQAAKIPRSRWQIIVRAADKMVGSERSKCSIIAARYGVERTTIKRILRMVRNG